MTATEVSIISSALSVRVHVINHVFPSDISLNNFLALQVHYINFYFKNIVLLQIL